ncbi:MAG: PAS domain S-box protein [Ignavibacteria bacterium]|nr:PAS domain S-box protein [Ignavibacteria bacterium]
MQTPPHIANILIDIIPDMCFVVSADGIISTYNEGARVVLGLPETPETPLRFSELLTEDSPRPIPVVIKTGELESKAEVRFKTGNGDVVDAILFLRVIEGPDQSFLYIIARDVSESKQKELDLLRFSQVVHYTINPIQITDSHNRMVYVNPAFERITGYSRDELIGENPRIMSSGKHSKKFWTEMWKEITQGNVWTGEIENRKKCGDPMFTQLVISPVVDNDGCVVGYLGAHRDISQQRQLEQQLVHTQKMESMGTLAAGIAHEVGNPLASISSIVQVLLRTVEDEFSREKLNLVQTQVQRINKIIRDLVDFSRPSNYKLQPTDLVRIVLDAVEIVRIGKKAKTVRFETDVQAQVPMLYLVPDQLSQVFINILLNSVDAINGRKDGLIETTITMDDDRVAVTMRDNGEGIRQEHLAKVFEPFFTTKKVGEGTGLGLWVSYGIMKSLKGDITVESGEGEGTSFCVSLPVTH